MYKKSIELETVKWAWNVTGVDRIKGGSVCGNFWQVDSLKQFIEIESVGSVRCLCQFRHDKDRNFALDVHNASVPPG